MPLDRSLQTERGQSTQSRQLGSRGNLPVPPDPFHWSISRTGRFAAGAAESAPQSCGGLWQTASMLLPSRSRTNAA
jgi:hypothetical protein